MISITHNLFLIAMAVFLLSNVLADYMKVPIAEVLAMDGLLMELPNNQFLYSAFTIPCIGGSLAIIVDRLADDMDKFCVTRGAPKTRGLIIDGKHSGDVSSDVAQFSMALPISLGNFLWN